jgi:hypothetical protein
MQIAKLNLQEKIDMQKKKNKKRKTRYINKKDHQKINEKWRI